MNTVCGTCNDTELIATTKAYRFGLRLLASLVKKEREYLCPRCGRRTSNDPISSDTPVDRRGRGNTRTGDVRRRQVMLTDVSPGGRDLMSVQFPAAYRSGRYVLFPTFEGNVQDGSVIRSVRRPGSHA